MYKLKTRSMRNEYEIIRLNEFRTRKVLSIFPFIIVNGFTSDFHWTGKWFKYVDIIEQKAKERFVEFEEWNYQHYWGEWKETWNLVSINEPLSLTKDAVEEAIGYKIHDFKVDKVEIDGKCVGLSIHVQPVAQINELIIPIEIIQSHE